MIVKWEPDWYELDQCIVVGDIDFFYLTKDSRSFEHGLSSSETYEYEVKAEILQITHPELGEIRGIITIGLDYSIYLRDGTVIMVNAEENPGEIFHSEYAVSDWSFEVQLHVMEKTGLTAIERQRMYSHNEQKKLRQERIKRYKALLGLSKADWES